MSTLGQTKLNGGRFDLQLGCFPSTCASINRSPEGVPQPYQLPREFVGSETCAPDSLLLALLVGSKGSSPFGSLRWMSRCSGIRWPTNSHRLSGPGGVRDEDVDPGETVTRWCRLKLVRYRPCSEHRCTGLSARRGVRSLRHAAPELMGVIV